MNNQISAKLDNILAYISKDWRAHTKGASQKPSGMRKMLRVFDNSNLSLAEKYQLIRSIAYQQLFKNSKLRHPIIHQFYEAVALLPEDPSTESTPINAAPLTEAQLFFQQMFANREDQQTIQANKALDTILLAVCDKKWNHMGAQGQCPKRIQAIRKELKQYHRTTENAVETWHHIQRIAARKRKNIYIGYFFQPCPKPAQALYTAIIFNEFPAKAPEQAHFRP